mgnify:CR=1 FL=1
MKTGIVVLNYNDAQETINFVNEINSFKIHIGYKVYKITFIYNDIWVSNNIVITILLE